MLFSTAGVAPALGSPITEKRAQVAQVKAQIDALDQKASIADEAYNEAGVSLSHLNRQVGANLRRLQALTKRQKSVQKRLAARVVDMYRSGPLGMYELLFGSTTFAEFTSTLDLMTRIGQQDASTIASVSRVRAQVATARTSLRAQQASAARDLTVRKASSILIQGELASRQKLYASHKAELDRLYAAERARQAAAAAAALAAARQYAARQAALAAQQRQRVATGSSGGGSSSSGGSHALPPGTPHTGVVAIALRCLGRPYQWGASGPGSFDCSGLMMYCYAQVGVSLPHSSRAQISCGRRVTRGQLQPGDLVFFGSPIHHVGMYIGGGQMIEAPYTGADVRISGAFRGDYAGACRP